jgi:hypothetical protein
VRRPTQILTGAPAVLSDALPAFSHNNLANSGNVPQIRHKIFFPNPSRFLIYHSRYDSSLVLWDTGHVIREATNKSISTAPPTRTLQGFPKVSVYNPVYGYPVELLAGELGRMQDARSLPTQGNTNMAARYTNFRPYSVEHLIPVLQHQSTLHKSCLPKANIDMNRL